MDPIKNTLLIIEDQVEVARFMSKVLNPIYGIVVAKDAEEGFLQLVKQRIDLILLDVSLPGRSGLEFCDVVKSDLQLRHIPVIMVTGLRTLEDKIKGFSMGADDYITKPFLIDELIARVEAAIRRTQTAQQHDLAPTTLDSRAWEGALSEGTDLTINISLN